MISFLEHTEHWENTEVELATRGVRVLLNQMIKLLHYTTSDQKMVQTGVDNLFSCVLIFTR